MTGHQIREAFIRFFLDKGHTFAKPSPVVLHDDPTLLFTNAGMNQFKDVFLGKGSRPYVRAANSQVCIRVSGKHNDLEDVGKDTHHLTLFEMLGNWSFGDYGKKEAITWAWELYTTVFNLPKPDLYATVYETDDESFALWKDLTDINPHHVLRFGKKDNFWEMGETGPCGPCSEIHLDRGTKACDKLSTPGHVCSVNGDCARFIELWNLVFIQSERLQDGSLIDLPAKHVDTGAGLERLTAYLQNSYSTYGTDLFTPILAKIENLVGTPYPDDLEAGMAFRVIADHCRTLTFGIADNVLPSNEGRGYVLRRLLRRAMRYGKQLGLNEPFLYQLVDPVVSTMGDYYDHLPKRQAFIETVIQAEEEAFLKTLQSGLSHFASVLTRLKSQNGTAISGSDAFKLYDTYGFPIDLTQLMAKEEGLTVDMISFESELTSQRERSRKTVKFLQAEFEDKPMGGEARLVTTEDDIVRMARHHTATHLLQAALRKILGEHVYQCGSLVDVDRLRFDFSHFKAISQEELSQIEAMVNQKIQENIPVVPTYHTVDEAKALGAMALFGEKYGETVRVITVGDFSKELCGGHHVRETNVIETVKIISETGVAAGTRRIEALAGEEALAAYHRVEEEKRFSEIRSKKGIYDALANELAARGNPIASLPNADIHQLLIAIKAAEKQLSLLKENQAAIASMDALKNRKLLENGIGLAIVHVSEDVQTMKYLSDHLAKEAGLVGLLVNPQGQVVVRTPEKWDKSTTAKEILNQLTSICGGSGGGKPNLVQAGGVDLGTLSAGVEKVETFLKAL